MIQDHTDHGESKEPMNSSPPLMYNDQSDLGSLIRIRVAPKEHTLKLPANVFVRTNLVTKKSHTDLKARVCYVANWKPFKIVICFYFMT